MPVAASIRRTSSNGVSGPIGPPMARMDAQADQSLWSDPSITARRGSISVAK
jgi:hypothetical protein